MKRLIRQYFFLVVAGTIIAGGILISVIPFIMNNPIKDRVNLPLNEITKMELLPGKYAIFYEYDNSSKKYGQITITHNNKVSDIREWITISVKDENQELDVGQDSSMTYAINQISGESIGSFKVLKEGIFEIAIGTQDSGDLKQIKITLIKDFTERFFSLFKKIGVYIVISIPFLSTGLWIYAKGGKVKQRTV